MSTYVLITSRAPNWSCKELVPVLHTIPRSVGLVNNDLIDKSSLQAYSAVLTFQYIKLPKAGSFVKKISYIVIYHIMKKFKRCQFLSMTIG